MNTPKPGWKTTEFWLTAATAAVGLLNSALGWNIPVETVATVVGGVAAYVLGRAVTKKPASE
jgi:membrane protein implicated in regulation of membrane protease activity